MAPDSWPLGRGEGVRKGSWDSASTPLSEELLRAAFCKSAYTPHQLVPAASSATNKRQATMTSVPYYPNILLKALPCFDSKLLNMTILSDQSDVLKI